MHCWVLGLLQSARCSRRRIFLRLLRSAMYSRASLISRASPSKIAFAHDAPRDPRTEIIFAVEALHPVHQFAAVQARDR